jgi:hypothetical protein
MDNHSGLLTNIGNWDWQPHKLKEQFGQLTFSDILYEVGKENDLLTRIGSRINKTIPQVIDILKKLRGS